MEGEINYFKDFYFDGFVFEIRSRAATILLSVLLFRMSGLKGAFSMISAKRIPGDSSPANTCDLCKFFRKIRNNLKSCTTYL